MTIREALGGPWSTHWTLWAALFIPTTLLVVLRESVSGFPHWWWPLVSAALQHLAVGIIVIGGGELARRRYSVLPLTILASLWLMAAVVRGVIAGALATTVAGAEPEFVERSLVWLLGTIVWVPLIVYTVAQLDRRRLLLGALDAVTALIEQQRSRSDDTGDEVRRALESAVRRSLQPALRDLVASLESSRDHVSVSALAELSMRVSQLHDRAADLLEPDGLADDDRRPARSTVRRAFDIPPRLPWVIAGLTMLSTTAILLPEVWRVFGDRAALEVTIAIAAASAALGLIPSLIARIAPESPAARGQRLTVVACATGIVVAVYVMLNSGIDPVTQNGLTVVPLLAIGLSIACVVHVGAIVLADANLEATAQLERQTELSQVERAAHDGLVDRERRRLADLMHGPVQGRLAACVMALNFTATSGAENGQSPAPADAALINSVLDHLRAVSRDLAVIAASEGPTSP